MNYLILLPLIVAASTIYTPSYNDVAMIRGEAFITNAYLDQIGLHLSGYLPTPCHVLRLASRQTPAGTDFTA